MERARVIKNLSVKASKKLSGGDPKTEKGLRELFKYNNMLAFRRLDADELASGDFDAKDLIYVFCEDTATEPDNGFVFDTAASTFIFSLLEKVMEQ